MKKYFLSILFISGCCCAAAQSLADARALFKQGKYAEALPVFKRLAKQSPSNANYNFWYGACCAETGQDSIAEVFLQKAAQRKLMDAYPYLTRVQMRTYKFDDAITSYENYISLLDKKKQDTQKEQKELEKAQTASLMLKGTEKICVIDSFVVDKNDFLSAYRLGHEAGVVDTYNHYFQTDRQSGTIYQNELGQKLYTAQMDEGKLALFSSDKLLDKWSAPREVPGLDSDGNNNYPYLLSDGTTLYYANDGENSLGGYDIFVTRLNTETGKFLKPDNLGMPYNSPANDYMMVIDEFNNLGWFASDRYQPEGKVCVYVFVPNENRETFDVDHTDPKTLRQAAMLRSIHSTWSNETLVRDAQQRLAGVSSSADAARKAAYYDFSFVIDDQLTYHFMKDFQSAEARKLFAQWQQMQKDHEALSQKLEQLRDFYAQSAEAKKQAMTPQILDLEKRTAQMQQELAQLEVKTRNTEKKNLQK